MTPGKTNYTGHMETGNYTLICRSMNYRIRYVHVHVYTYMYYTHLYTHTHREFEENPAAHSNHTED